MAIAIGVGSKGAASATPTTTASVTTQTSGSLFVIATSFQDTFVSVSDNKGNSGYTQAGSQILVDTANTVNSLVYYQQNGAGGTGHTFSGSYSASNPHTVLAAEVTGAALTGALDTATSIRDTASPFTATITPTAGNRMLVGAFFGNSGSNPATHAESSGFTVLSSADETNGVANWVGCIAYRYVVADGVTSYTASFTEAGNTAEGAVHLMAFKEAAVGPTITVQPVQQSAASGSTATFSVTATSSGGSLSYLWYSNGVSTGGTASSYTTPTLTNADNGEQYYCAVTDSNGTTNTATVYLFIIGESSADGDKINSAWFTR